jgi:hypothetical protein
MMKKSRRERDEAEYKRTFNAGHCNPFLSSIFPSLHPPPTLFGSILFCVVWNKAINPSRHDLPLALHYLRCTTTPKYRSGQQLLLLLYFFSTFIAALAYVRRPRGAQIQDWRLVIHPHPINIAPLNLPSFLFLPTLSI